ncbi:MAG TPA: cytochrome c oxidase assembly protein [Gemmatimonadaceae bacterium]|nr:cytochrome c oxidase assembly protein [Gemmatimonadaceae bacterium]
MHRHLTRAIAVIIGSLTLPAIAAAHTGRALQPHDLWHAWTFEPLVMIALGVAAVLYIIGLRRLWAREVGKGIRRWEAASFAAGWLAVALALVSPVHSLGGVLFTAHMAQHELLISICAPLLVLGRPIIPFLWGLPQAWRRRLGDWARVDGVSGAWRTIALPPVAFSLHAIALWVWHLPGPYQSTLTSEVMHSLQHASFLGTALLFWWTIFKTRGSELGYGAAVFYLFGTALQTGALGALLTFASDLWYPAYATTTRPWGLSPLDDQQLGGLIMWIPGSIPYVIAGLYMFARWLRASEARSLRHQTAMVAARAAPLVVALIALSSCDRASGDNRYQLANADMERGRTAIRKYGCGSCHDIPGVTGAQGMVGPPLEHIAQRVYIAGVLPNEPDNMIKWLENPPGVDPKTAMPYMAVTPRDARDIAAYLYTLR